MNSPSQPTEADMMRQQLLMYLRDKAFEDAVGPVRKKIAGDWLLQRDYTLIDKLVAKHLPELAQLFQAHLKTALQAVLAEMPEKHTGINKALLNEEIGIADAQIFEGQNETLAQATAAVQKVAANLGVKL